jgi:hypothetical protein
MEQRYGMDAIGYLRDVMLSNDRDVTPFMPVETLERLEWPRLAGPAEWPGWLAGRVKEIFAEQPAALPASAAWVFDRVLGESQPGRVVGDLQEQFSEEV